jgi:hypothetical protein
MGGVFVIIAPMLGRPVWIDNERYNGGDDARDPPHHLCYQVLRNKLQEIKAVIDYLPGLYKWATVS